MKLRSVLKIALNNLKRVKFRTILTSFGVSIGIGAMILLVSFGEGVRRQAVNSILGFGSLRQIFITSQSSNVSGATSNAQEPKKITKKDLDKISQIKHVKKVYPQHEISEIQIFSKEATASAFLNVIVTESFTDPASPKIEEGKFFESDEDLAILIDKKTKENLKVEVGDHVKIKVVFLKFPRSSRINPDPEPEKIFYGDVEARVAAIVKTPFEREGEGPAVPYLSLAVAEELNKSLPEKDPAGELIKKDEYYNAHAYVDSPNNVKEVAQKIKGLGLSVETAFSLIEEINKGFLILKVVLGSFGAIALAVALLGIINTMLMSVLERTREIGILKALGARNRDISRIFLFEAGLIGFLGSLIGIGAAWSIGKIIEIIAKTFFSSQLQSFTQGAPTTTVSELEFFHIDPTLAIGTIIFAVLISMIAGFIPARRAAKLDPIKALRNE